MNKYITNLMCLMHYMYAAFVEDLNRPNVIVTTTVVRLEAALDANGNSITFRLKEDGTRFSDEERKLLTDEEFMPVAARIRIGKFSKDGTGLRDANLIPSTHVDANLFTNTAEQAALNMVYAGELSVAVKGTNIIDRMNTDQFLMVPENPILAAAGTGQSVDLRATYGGRSYESQGYAPLFTKFSWKGSDDIEAKLKLGPGVITGIDGPDANLKNKVIIEFIGHMTKGNTYGAALNC